MAARDDDAPTFGQQPESPLLRLFARRWVRWAAVAFVFVVVVLTAWYQLAVAPHLTAMRYQLSVAGGDDQLTVHIDDERERATISGGTNGLTRVIIAGDSVFVPADEVGAGDLGFEWLEVPNAAFDREVRLPAVEDIERALSRGVKDCAAPNDDAAFVVGLFLDVDPSADGVSLCDGAVGRGADDGEDLVVKSGAVRPSALGDIPPASLGQLDDVPDADAVVDALVRLFRCEGWRVDEPAC